MQWKFFGMLFKPSLRLVMCIFFTMLLHWHLQPLTSVPDFWIGNQLFVTRLILDS